MGARLPAIIQAMTVLNQAVTNHLNLDPPPLTEIQEESVTALVSNSLTKVINDSNDLLNQNQSVPDLNAYSNAMSELGASIAINPPTERIREFLNQIDTIITAKQRAPSERAVHYFLEMSYSITGLTQALYNLKRDFNALDPQSQLVIDVVEKINNMSSKYLNQPQSLEDLEAYLAALNDLPESFKVKLSTSFKMIQERINQIQLGQIANPVPSRFAPTQTSARQQREVEIARPFAELIRIAANNIKGPVMRELNHPLRKRLEQRGIKPDNLRNGWFVALLATIASDDLQGKKILSSLIPGPGSSKEDYNSTVSRLVELVTPPPTPRSGLFKKLLGRSKTQEPSNVSPNTSPERAEITPEQLQKLRLEALLNIARVQSSANMPEAAIQKINDKLLQILQSTGKPNLKEDEIDSLYAFVSYASLLVEKTAILDAFIKYKKGPDSVLKAFEDLRQDTIRDVIEWAPIHERDALNELIHSVAEAYLINHGGEKTELVEEILDGTVVNLIQRGGGYDRDSITSGATRDDFANDVWSALCDKPVFSTFAQYSEIYSVMGAMNGLVSTIQADKTEANVVADMNEIIQKQKVNVEQLCNAMNAAPASEYDAASYTDLRGKPPKNK